MLTGTHFMLTGNVLHKAITFQIDIFKLLESGIGLSKIVLASWNYYWIVCMTMGLCHKEFLIE